MGDDTSGRLFPSDRPSKRERVERTLNLQPVDRVALHDQVSFNPDVISLYTGKPVCGFDYTLEDVCEVIRRTLDACFPPVAPRGTERVTDADGFTTQHDNWTSWRVSRAWADDDVDAWREYVLCRTDGLRAASFDAERARVEYRCLEPAHGMDAVELKQTWTKHVWAGGVDGVGLLERGTPADVRREVRRQIEETDALRTGGLFIGSFSEINPPIKPENYRAMVEAAEQCPVR